MRTLLTLVGAAAFLSGVLLIALGLASMEGVHFPPGAISPNMPPAWRIVCGVGAIAVSAALRRGPEIVSR